VPAAAPPALIPTASAAPLPEVTRRLRSSDVVESLVQACVELEPGFPGGRDANLRLCRMVGTYSPHPRTYLSTVAVRLRTSPDGPCCGDVISAGLRGSCYGALFDARRRVVCCKYLDQMCNLRERVASMWCCRRTDYGV
jgi:hypothetical protein